MCTLFCLIKFSAQKFTTHQRAKYNDLDHHEDMDTLYKELSAEVSTVHRGVPTPSLKSPLLQTRQTSYPYAQKSWPSDFDWDVSYNMQSGKQSSDSQTAYSFIPSPIVENALPSVQNHSHSFSASTPSSYPIDAALQSSRRRSSSAPQFWKKPNSPKFPRNYRPQTYQGPLIDAKPARPGSRPSMPPAAFWQYAADQQTRGISPGRLQSWQIDRDKKRRESSISRYPVVPTIPHKAAFRMEDKAQRMTRTPTKVPYESLIGSTVDDDAFDILDSNVVGEQMRDAKEPRVERRLEKNSATEARRSRLVKKRPLDNEIYPVWKQK